MNNTQLEYAEGIRNLLSINPDPILEGSWTPLQIAKDYAEVGEDCGLTLDEAVEIIERELASYLDEQGFVEMPKRKKTAEQQIKIAETRDRLNERANEQARILLGKYKWTPPQRRMLEQQAEKGYIISTHGDMSKAFGRFQGTNPDDIATYRIMWLGKKVPAKKRLNFTC